jgi:DNA-binding NtrC family response regulator
LRERPEDIPLLVRHYLEKEARELDKEVPIIPDSVMQTLQEHPYTGNVRELINQIRLALITSTSRGLDIEAFPGVSAASQSSGNLRVIQDKCYRLQGAFKTFPGLDEVERLVIGEALHITGGSKGEAARMLGISRTTLNKKLNEEPDC